MTDREIIYPYKAKRQIKTIVASNAEAFDERVNAELDNGWEIQEIKVFPANTLPIIQIVYIAIMIKGGGDSHDQT